MVYKCIQAYDQYQFVPAINFYVTSLEGLGLKKVQSLWWQ